MPAMLSRHSIFFNNYIVRDLDNTKNTLIQAFPSVPGCQTRMCKRGNKAENCKIQYLFWNGLFILRLFFFEMVCLICGQWHSGVRTFVLVFNISKHFHNPVSINTIVIHNSVFRINRRGPWAANQKCFEIEVWTILENALFNKHQ